MSTLHLGVINIPYGDGSGETTSSVAKELEQEYGVIELFFDVYEKEIAEIISASIAAEFDKILLGHDFSLGEINTSAIDDLFKQYLAKDEWQKLTGRVIMAAKMGVSKRFKDVYNKQKKRGPRPAFIDTGQYQASFKSWVD